MNYSNNDLQGIGEIILIKGLAFNDGRPDHSITRGRPCIILDNNDGMLTLLPLTSTSPKGRSFEDRTFELTSNDIETFKKHYKLHDKVYIDLKEIIRKEMYFYEPVGRVRSRTYCNLLKFLRDNMKSEYGISYEYYMSRAEEIQKQKKKTEKYHLKKQNNPKYN